MHLYDSLFRSEHADSLLSGTNFLKQMLQVEISLAKSQAEGGIIKREYADAITAVCRLENIDVEKLSSQIPLGGNAAIPLVKQLRALLEKNNKEAAAYLHYGATSQDIVDTALVLQIKEYAQWLLSEIVKLEKALVAQMKAHRETVMIGRTLLQHAKPITFGYKISVWLTAIDDDREKIQELLDKVLKVQLGGPVGNRNEKIGNSIAAELAKSLGLSPADNWHTRRGTLAQWSSYLGILSGNIGKVAKDISLLMQTEVGEVFEGAEEGKGGSSSMPQKRNPTTCVAILANAKRTPHLVASLLSVIPQEHERAVGGWHAEWEPLYDLMRLTAGSLEKSVGLIETLEVNSEKMRSNIELTNGLVYSENVLIALSSKMDYQTAHTLLEQASEKCMSENKQLKDVLQQMDLGLDNLDELFDPAISVAHNQSALDDIIKVYENKL